MEDVQPNLVRRHRKSCEFRSRAESSCDCPIWIDQMVNGRRIMKSLRLTDMKAAMEVYDLAPPAPPEPVDELIVARAIVAIADSSTSTDEEAVYVIGHPGTIKIGVALDVSRRLQQLQTGTCAELRIRRVFRGGFSLEQQLHDLLRPFVRRGEWFRLAPTVVALLRRSQAFDLSRESVTGK